MSLNDQLIEATKWGDHGTCRQLKKEGADDFFRMFQVAAEDGDMDMCRLAIKWHDKAAALRKDGATEKIDVSSPVLPVGEVEIIVRPFRGKDSGLFIVDPRPQNFIMINPRSDPKIVAYFDGTKLKPLTPKQIQEVEELSLRHVPGMVPEMPKAAAV